MERGGIFEGGNPIDIARRWLAEAEKTEPNDPNAMALATVDGTGLPDVRMVLLKAIEDDAFVFFTNFGSAKADQIELTGKASAVLHWKSLRRQIRFRGTVTRVNAEQADAYFNSRSLQSRLGAIASRQSHPLPSRATLLAQVAKVAAVEGPAPKRPDFWGGYRIQPSQIEFWADGAFRLHDRFRWLRQPDGAWDIVRLYP